MKVCIKVGDIYFAFGSAIDAQQFISSAQTYKIRDKYSDDKTFVKTTESFELSVVDDAAFIDESSKVADLRSMVDRLNRELKDAKAACAAAAPKVVDVVAAMEADPDGDDCAP